MLDNTVEVSHTMVRTTVPQDLVTATEEVTGLVPEGGFWEKGSVTITEHGAVYLGELATLFSRCGEFAMSAATTNVFRKEYLPLIEQQYTAPVEGKCLGGSRRVTACMIWHRGAMTWGRGGARSTPIRIFTVWQQICPIPARPRLALVLGVWVLSRMDVMCSRVAFVISSSILTACLIGFTVPGV